MNEEEQRKVREGLVLLLENAKRETEETISNEDFVGIKNNLRKFKNCVEIIRHSDYFWYSEYEKWRICYETALKNAKAVFETGGNCERDIEELMEITI